MEDNFVDLYKDMIKAGYEEKNIFNPYLLRTFKILQYIYEGKENE